jgi:hypothetical protein
MPTLEGFLAAQPWARAVFDRVTALCAAEIRVSRSQIAFRRKRGFAYLWLPGRYLRTPGADVVLSIALGRHDLSPRFKQVTHPSPRHWMHHFEVHAINDLDDEVAAWLQEAAARAG